MTTPASRPNAYTGIKQTRPPQRYAYAYPPTSNDYKNFDVGDEWLDKSTSIWWVLCKKLQGVSTWEKMAGPGTSLEAVITDSGTAVPDSDNDINLLGTSADGIHTAGAVSTVTLHIDQATTTQRGTLETATDAEAVAITANNVAIVPANLGPVFASPPPLGSTVPNTVAGTSYALPSQIVPGQNSKVIQVSSTTVNADGDVQLIGGANIQGILMLSWRTSLRDDYLIFSISYVQFTGKVKVNIISQLAGSPPVFTNFRFYVDGSGAVGTLVCAVGNRNSGTGPITATFWSMTDWNDATLFPSNSVVSQVPIYGMWQFPNDPYGSAGWVKDAATTGQPTALSLLHETSSTPGNNIGVAQEFFHAQADGTIVSGAKIYTTAPNASTNVQATELFLQVNNGGGLIDHTLLNTNGDLALKKVGGGFRVSEGANAKMGQATLGAGTATVATTAVSASSRIFLTCAVVGGTQGILSVGTITASTSFVINSSNGADTSTVNWIIFDPS